MCRVAELYAKMIYSIVCIGASLPPNVMLVGCGCNGEDG